jgi:hypothetical protein
MLFNSLKWIQLEYHREFRLTQGKMEINIMAYVTPSITKIAIANAR